MSRECSTKNITSLQHNCVMMESLFEELCMPEENFENFNMSLVAARISNTDSLVCTVQNQLQEIENLKRQMLSFNESAIQINQALATEKCKSTKLESNESMLKDRITHLEAERDIIQNEIINERALKEQIVAKLEETEAENSQLVDMCKQFVIQSEILSEHRLNNKSLMAWYSKALDILKTNGVPVKRFKAKKNGKGVACVEQCSMAPMTDMEADPIFSMVAAMTDEAVSTVPTVVMSSIATMTENEVKPQRTFCDKSTMHFQTTATRGTNTKWTPLESNSVGTNYPEPISIQEIFSQTICILPEMVTAIDELKWPTTHSETQTIGSTEPSKSYVEASTMTHIKNIRKQISYNRTIKRQLLQQHSANRLHAIKKEEISPIGSMTNLAFPLTGDSMPRVPPINPQLSGLWQMFGETMFRIIGSGRIFEGDTSVMEEINANLNVIRNTVENRSFTTQSDGINSSSERDEASTVGDMISTATNTGTREEISVEAETQYAEIISNTHTTNVVTQLPPEPFSKTKEQNYTGTDVPKIRIVSQSPTSIDATETSEPNQPYEVIFKVPKITRRVKRKLPSEPNITLNTSISPKLKRSLTSFAKSKKRKITNASTKESYPDIDIVNISKYFELPTAIEPIIDRSDDAMDSSEDDERDESLNVATDEAELFFMEEEDVADDDNLIITLPPLSEDLLTYSPASPTPSDRNETAEPETKIPLDSVVPRSLSITDTILKSYSHPKRYQLNRIEDSCPRLYAKLREHIEIYLTSNYSESELSTCCSTLLSLTVRPKILSTCVLEVIEDTENESLETIYTPPAPAMTVSHQRIILLIIRITLQLPGFDKYCLLQVEQLLFTLGACELKFVSLINLTRLYLGLADITVGQPSRIRLFIYKCMYYKQKSAVSMVYTALMAYPDCLPRLPDLRTVQDHMTQLVSEFSQFDPLCQAIHVMLMNTFFKKQSSIISNHNNCNAGDFNIEEMAFLMRTYYNHTPETRLTVELVVQNLMNRIEANRLRNVPYAFILLAKWKGSEWAHSKLIDEQLIVLLKKYMVNISISDQNDSQIAAILFVIGSIVKVFPVTVEIDRYLQIFVSVIKATPAHRQCVQEAAIASLLQMNRFGTVNVYQRIREWKPPFAISRKLWLQLQTFVHRKCRSFWQ